jgi:hypothetical protein
MAAVALSVIVLAEPKAYRVFHNVRCYYPREHEKEFYYWREAKGVELSTLRRQCHRNITFEAIHDKPDERDAVGQVSVEMVPIEGREEFLLRWNTSSSNSCYTRDSTSQLRPTYTGSSWPYSSGAFPLSNYTVGNTVGIATITAQLEGQDFGLGGTPSVASSSAGHTYSNRVVSSLDPTSDSFCPGKPTSLSSTSRG